MPGKICARLLFVMAAVTLSVHCATSADIKTIAGKDSRAVIVIVGEIKPGDADTFTAAVKQANDAGKFVANVRLNSEGGNLLEGVKLADAVRFGKMSTNVGKNATCASACFLVFAAGNTKFATYDAKVGVHGASEQNGDESLGSGAATVSMARIAKELGVPPAIIGRMVVTPPDEIVWLSPQDLQSMGATMVGKPNQVQAITPLALDQGLRQTPEVKSSSIQSRSTTRQDAPAPTWEGLLEKAIQFSKQQNNGTPDFARVCQPEMKVCFNGLSFTLDDGTYTLMKATENLDGKVIRRELCTFNVNRDVRSCLNWDTGSSHRDMQNAKGEWETVSDN